MSEVFNIPSEKVKDFLNNNSNSVVLRRSEPKRSGIVLENLMQKL